MVIFLLFLLVNQKLFVTFVTIIVKRYSMTRFYAYYYSFYFYFTQNKNGILCA